MLLLHIMGVVNSFYGSHSIQLVVIVHNYSYCPATKCKYSYSGLRYMFVLIKDVMGLCN